VKFTLRDVAGAWARRALDNTRRADRVMTRMRGLPTAGGMVIDSDA
jgi:hypothetical protein